MRATISGGARVEHRLHGTHGTVEAVRRTLRTRIVTVRLDGVDGQKRVHHYYQHELRLAKEKTR